MLKVLFAMMMLTQLTVVQAEEETLSSEAYLAISEILKENGADEKRLVLLPDPGEEEGGVVTERLCGICCTIVGYPIKYY